MVVIGLSVRGLVVMAELAAWWQLGSETLLVDAVASLLDIGSSLALLVAVLMATRPPDEDHPFGHGRYEPLAGLQLGLLIAGAGVWLAMRGAKPSPMGDADWIFLIPLAATALLTATGWRMRVVARRERSAALAAEAGHYFVDAITSLVATVALFAAQTAPALANGYDRWGAIFLAIVMVGLGLAAAWSNLHEIMDRAPDQEFFDRVRSAARAIEGVEDVEKVRIQAAGPDAHVDIDIEVDPAMTVAESHVITQHVRAAIQAEWPLVRDVVVHVEPYFEGDH